MDGFKKWGIEHLSASSLNAYLAEPAIWVMRYVYKIKSESAAMFRGTAVEKALCDSLRQNAGVEACIHTAEFLFDSECERARFPLGHPDIVKERSAIRPMIESGYVGLIPLAEDGMEFQKRIEIDLGVGIPLIGYADIVGSKIYELKTTLRMPTDEKSLKRAHLRQAAIYSVHEGKPAELCYISPPVKSGAHQGFKLFPVKETRGYMEELKRTARSLRAVLTMASSKKELTEILVPDYDRFQWDDESIAHAKRIWGE